MHIHEETKSVVLRVRDPFSLRALLPKSKTIDHPDYNFAAQHTLDVTLMLRNIGIKVPSPIRYQYKWPGKFKPYDHQVDMAEFWTFHRRGFNLSEQGTMKTNSALWAADYLMRLGLVHKALVCAPLSTLRTVWMQDIFDTLMHRQAALIHGSCDARLKALKTPSDFFILNHDGVKISEVRKVLIARKDIDLIIIDEGDEFRNATTEKYKALEEILQPRHRLWWQTGTPTPNAPTDAWAQVKMVTPSRAPKYFGQFKRDTMMQLSPFKWIARKEAKDIVFEAMQPAIRFKKADCIDLPPVVTLARQAELTKEQRAAFDVMKEELFIDARNHAGLSKSILAVNAADKLSKMRQILCGVVKDPVTGEYVQLPHKPRVDTLLEGIRGANAKAIVIVPFKGIIQNLAKEVGKHYTVGMLNGDVSANKRHKIITDFKHTTDPHVLMCHPKVMSHGLNLTEADTTIFYAPIYGNSQFQQVIERFNRAGQTRKMTILRIGAHPVEWDLYRDTDAAVSTQQKLMTMYEALTQT